MNHHPGFGRTFSFRPLGPVMYIGLCPNGKESPAIRSLLEELKGTDRDKLKMAAEAASKGKRVNFGPL